MGHDKLANYFQTNFSLMQFHKWNITEIEAMLPWERYVYINLLKDHLENEAAKQRDREAEIRTKMKARR